MELAPRPHSPDEPIDFGTYMTAFSISVGLDDLPPQLKDFVFVGRREGLGYWHFIELETACGRVLFGLANERDLGAEVWCESALEAGQIRLICESLFQTSVGVMNPDTGEIL